MNSILISTKWLVENLDYEHLVLLDVSMSKIVGKSSMIYNESKFIPNSQKCYLENDLCNVESIITHAFPTKEQFESELTRLGITSESIVVIYDNQGIYSSPRAWWIFYVMGFRNAFILDGGLPKWMSEGRKTVSHSKIPVTKSYVCTAYDGSLVCDSNYVLRNTGCSSHLVIDVRSSERFFGKIPEPRTGVRSGNIPHSINLPFSKMLSGYCYKEIKLLKAELLLVIPDGIKCLIFSCGSGITACIVLVAARLAGYSETLLYDGSWAEWGSNENLPINEPLFSMRNRACSLPLYSKLYL